MSRGLRYGWIRFRRNLRKTVVSHIGGRIDEYGSQKIR